MSLENVKSVFDSKERTLRSLVQIVCAHFDPLGLTAPLLSQARHTMSLCMRMTKAVWDQKLDDELWSFAVKQMLELYRSTLINFERFPIGFSTQKGKSTLVVMADASISLIMTAFLVTHNEEGGCEVVQIQCKTFLANTPNRDCESWRQIWLLDTRLWYNG